MGWRVLFAVIITLLKLNTIHYKLKTRIRVFIIFPFSIDTNFFSILVNLHIAYSSIVSKPRCLLVGLCSGAPCTVELRRAVAAAIATEEAVDPVGPSDTLTLFSKLLTNSKASARFRVLSAYAAMTAKALFVLFPDIEARTDWPIAERRRLAAFAPPPLSRDIDVRFEYHFRPCEVSVAGIAGGRTR